MYTKGHRWARLLTQQTSITIYRLPNKENKLSLSIFVCSKQIEVCRFGFPFAANKLKVLFSISSLFCIYIYICCSFKRKMKAQVIFHNPFTICSSCKWTFVVCPYVDEEKHESYSIWKNGLNGLNGLAHVCQGVIHCTDPGGLHSIRGEGTWSVLVPSFNH